MRIKILYFFAVLCMLPDLLCASSVTTENEQLLSQLDKLISDKEIYHRQREKNIADFKHRLSLSSDDLESYNLCGSLFYEYLHYQADSSLYYVDLKLSMRQECCRKSGSICGLRMLVCCRAYRFAGEYAGNTYGNCQYSSDCSAPCKNLCMGSGLFQRFFIHISNGLI